MKNDSLKLNRIARLALLCTALPVLAACSLAAQTQPATAAPQSAAAQSKSVLTVKINGLRNTKGRVRVALYKDAAGFPTDPSSIVIAKPADIDPKTLTAVAVFEDLPQGVYAATVLHDENLVGKMEYDAQGMPLEGYGISNNPSSSYGPPSFDDAKFTVTQSSAAIEIKMTYWQ